MIKILKTAGKEKSGFTLIEMLVVIGIIAVLASLVLVGLGGARRAGADTKKIANLNQVRNSLELYYLKNGSYPAGDGVKINTLGLGLGNIVLDDTYLYRKDGDSYLIGTTLSQGSKEGIKNGTIGNINCAAADLLSYCLTSE